MNSEIDPAANTPGRPVRRPGSRRVVMLSEADAKRLAAGEFSSAEELLQAKQRGGAAAGEPPARSAREQEILNEVPPHFGKI